MANELQIYPGQILGTDSNSETKHVLVDIDGKLETRSQIFGKTLEGVEKSIKVDGDGYLLVKTDESVSGNALDFGIATGGSKLYLDDTSKDFEPDMFLGAVAKIQIGNISYLRSVVGNTSTRIGIAPLIGSPATAILGSSEAGEVTITCLTDGDVDYQVEVVVSSGQNMELSASFVDPMLTVYLGTDGTGAADNAKNTATAIAVKIDELSAFSAEMTGAGGVIAVTEDPVNFSGGIDPVVVTAGCEYQIKPANSNIIWGLSSDTKPTVGVPKGRVFYEIDTGIASIWNGSSWEV